MRLLKSGPIVTAVAMVAVLCLAAAVSINAIVTTTAGEGSASRYGPADSLPTVALPPELDRVLRDYERAWAAGDEAALAALFTDDALRLPSGFPAVQGRAAIQQSYEDVIVPVQLRALAYAADGTAGYIVGAYTHEPLDFELGKFTFALRRAPGGPWMIASEIQNVSYIQKPDPPAASARQPSAR
jgi:hypothetical protein